MPAIKDVHPSTNTPWYADPQRLMKGSETGSSDTNIVDTPKAPEERIPELEGTTQPKPIAQNDPWAAAGFTRAAPADPWAAAGFTKPPVISPDEIAPAPPAFQQRLAQGSELLKNIKALSDQRGNIDPDVKNQFKNAWDMIAGGYSDSHSDDFWSRLMAPVHIGEGILAGASMPFSVPQAKIGRAIEGATGGLITSKNVDTALMGLSARGALQHFDTFVNTAQVAEDGSALKGAMVNPLVDGGEGVHTRLEAGPDGQLQGKAVGTFPPKPQDFENAAANITPKPAEQVNAQKNMLAKWHDDGLNPAELSAEAQNNPALRHDLSAAQTPPSPLPPRPDPRYIQDLDDAFYRIGGAKTADQAEFLNLMDTLPASIKNTEVQEAWYKYGEGDHSVTLTPEQGKLYNQYMVPLKREELRQWEEAKKTQLDVSDYDPAYMHRVVKGKTPQIDYLAGEGGADANPIYNGPGLLNRQASSLKERKFFAVENAAGERQVVTVNKGELNFIKGEGAYSQEKPLKAGDEITIGDQQYTLKHALTSEIEANTDVRYYQNALVNTVDNIIHLRGVNRAVYAIQQMRSSPEWAKYVTSDFETAPKEWITPQMPMFRNDRMDPKLAHLIDDFYGRAPLDGLQTALEKINRFAVGSLFWTPIPHALNAGAWWATERGWDWVTPGGYKSLAVDGAKAIREVVTQGPKYQELLREGASLQYGKLVNRGFYQQLLQRAGMEFAKNPEQFSEIAKIVGHSPIDLIKSFYNAAARQLWAASDVFAMQRILELERKGMTARAAIDQAEHIMPNYRVPSEIMGSRTIQQIYTNPNLFMFSKYHYGVLKGYANMATALAVGTAAEKSRAIGSMMVLGTLQLMIWPAISALLEKATGEENLKAPSAGPGRLINPIIGKVVNATPDMWPDFVKHYYNDDNGLLSAFANLVPLSPMMKWGLETVPFNRYAFSGRTIAEPADIRNNNWGRVAGQEAEHTAQTLFEPYSPVNEAFRTGKPLTQVILEHSLGLTNKTAEQETSKVRSEKYQGREAKSRAKKPAGLIEQMIGQ